MTNPLQKSKTGMAYSAPMIDESATQSVTIVDATVVSSRIAEKYVRFHQILKVPVPKKLVFINPPQVPEDMFSIEIARMKGYYAYPPIGLLYLCAVARTVYPDIELRVLDLNFEMLKRCHEISFRYDFWKELLWEELRLDRSTHVGVSCMFGATKPIFMEITAWLHQQFPDLPVLVGGVQASYDFQELLEQRCAEVVFQRESESSFRTFLRNCMRARASLSVAPPHGVAFGCDGEVIECPGMDLPSEEDIDLDIRPFYDLIPIAEYHRYGSLAAFSRYNGEDKPFATVLAKRGCRAQC
ncbi:MAG: hypothetical protein EPO64_07475, partial [Nitrospirae bacterium]